MNVSQEVIASVTVGDRSDKVAARAVRQREMPTCAPCAVQHLDSQGGPVEWPVLVSPRYLQGARKCGFHRGRE